MAWLLLAHAAALAAFWWLPSWAARRDAARFNAAPAADDLHAVFHRQRLLERLGIAVGIAGLASWPTMCFSSGSWWPYLLATAGLLSAAGGIWAFRFNPLLNVARALAYVGPYYVSPDPRAALFPDRLLWTRAMRALPRGPLNDAELHRARVDYAAHELRQLLRLGLVAGLVGYGAAMVLLLLK